MVHSWIDGIAWLLAGVLPSGEALPIDFETPRLISHGERVSSTCTTDVDGDGLLDVVATYGSGGRFRVFSGDGAGAFRPQTENSIPSAWLGSIASADFDLDGNADLAVANRGDDTLWVLLGDGAGNFVGTAHDLGFGENPVAVATADFDRNGFPDVAVANNDGHTVSVFLGLENGAFAPVRDFDMGMECIDLVVVDFDGDGELDLITCASYPRPNGWVRVRHGDGNGLFPRSASTSFQGEAMCVAAGDVDGDGRLELAVGSRPTSVGFRIHVYRADGPRRLALDRALVIGPRPYDVLFVGTSGHEPPDLLVLTSADIEIYRNGPSGLMEPPEPLSFSWGVTNLAQADFDGDRRPDLLASCGNETSLVWMGSGAAVYPIPTRVQPGAADANSALGDCNGDGALDVVSVTRGAEHFVFHAGDGRGGFRGTTFPIPAGGRSVSLADVNRDGDLDVVALSRPADCDGSGVGTLSVSLGNGDGEFAPGREIDAGPCPDSLSIADFDGDSILDAVVTSADAGRVSLFAADGFGGFVPYGQFPVRGGPVEAAVGELTGDGVPDIAVLRRSDAAITLFAGDGFWNFTRSTMLETPPSPVSLVVADLDGLGAHDLAVATDVGRTIALWFSDGGGGFEDEALLEGVSPFRSIAAADFDRDGINDLFGTTVSGSFVIRGEGGRSFGARADFFAGGAPSSAAAGDFDGDGATDIIVSNDDLDGLVLLFNRFADHFGARAGNVNAALGPVQNVVFVNGQRGSAEERRLLIDRLEPFVLRVKAPPALLPGPAGFALYATVGEPRPWTLADTPFGTMCFPPPLLGYSPKRVWNNTSEPEFGSPDAPSMEAPTIVLRSERGVRRRFTFTLQGLIEDPASPSGTYAVTNAIVVESR